MTYTHDGQALRVSSGFAAITEGSRPRSSSLVPHGLAHDHGPFPGPATPAPPGKPSIPRAASEILRCSGGTCIACPWTKRAPSFETVARNLSLCVRISQRSPGLMNPASTSSLREGPRVRRLTEISYALKSYDRCNQPPEICKVLADASVDHFPPAMRISGRETSTSALDVLEGRRSHRIVPKPGRMDLEAGGRFRMRVSLNAT